MEVDGVLQMNLKDTAEVFVEFGGKPVSLIEMIDGWAARVLNLYSDASGLSDFEWTSHDLIGSLIMRDAVQRGVEQLVQDDRPVPALEAADALFRSFTREDPQRLLVEWEPGIPSLPWWWTRIPARGPIADEIAESS